MVVTNKQLVDRKTSPPSFLLSLSFYQSICTKSRVGWCPTFSVLLQFVTLFFVYLLISLLIIHVQPVKKKFTGDIFFMNSIL